MNHVKIAFTILLLLIGMSTGCVYLVHRQCHQVLSVLGELELAAEAEDRENAAVLCDTALEIWEDSQSILLCMVSRDKLTAAEESLCRLRPLLDEDCDEFSAELAMVQAMILNIDEGEMPYFTNIF